MPTSRASRTVATGLTLEPDWARALGVRPRVSTVIFDRRRRLLPQQRSDGGQWGEPRLQVVRDPDGNVWHSVSLCFESAVQGGELTACDETLSPARVAPARLPASLLSNHRTGSATRAGDGPRPSSARRMPR